MPDRKSTRLNSSHSSISYAVFCFKEFKNGFLFFNDTATTEIYTLSLHAALPILMERPFVATFHALGVHILRENARTIGLNRHFNIFDRSDSKKSVRQAMENVGVNPKQFEPGRILEIIAREKGNNLIIAEYEQEVGNEYLPGIVAKVWREYDKILATEKALDFDDLLLRTVRLLKNQPAILEKYQNNWHYLLIDEYQDTNKIQYELAKLLADKNKNICAVGDTDQLMFLFL